MSVEEHTVGECRLILGECREVLPTLEAVDAVVTDPPYGIAYNFQKTSRVKTIDGRRVPWTPAGKMPWPKVMTGDTQTFDPTPWLAFPQVILWGANHYASRLPDSGAWFIWDKRDGRTSNDQSDCELAWSNVGRTARLHRQLWRGMIRAGEDAPSRSPKQHPAQKPIELMLWCVGKTTGTVLDPYAGSFTTGLACMRLGRRFTGIEIERRYFDIGCARLEAAYAALEEPACLVV